MELHACFLAAIVAAADHVVIELCPGQSAMPATGTDWRTDGLPATRIPQRSGIFPTRIAPSKPDYGIVPPHLEADATRSWRENCNTKAQEGVHHDKINFLRPRRFTFRTPNFRQQFS